MRSYRNITAPNSFPQNDPYSSDPANGWRPDDWEEARKKKYAALRWGCLIFLWFVIFSGLTSWGVIYYFYVQLINTWTDTAAMYVPTDKFTEAEAAALDKQIEDYKIKRKPLRLSVDELNILAVRKIRSDVWKYHIEDIDERGITGAISINLSKYRKTASLGRFKGRYLNMRGLYVVSTEKGRVFTRPVDIKIKGREADEELIGLLIEENHTSGVAERMLKYGFRAPFGKIEIIGNELVITPKELVKAKQ